MLPQHDFSEKIGFVNSDQENKKQGVFSGWSQTGGFINK
jgi:hypothetical protein